METQLRGVLSKLDLAEVSREERAIVTTLKNDLTDTRLDIRDYEFSETRAEQLRLAKQARASLDKVRSGILRASEYNVFNAVDVAQYTAQLEQIVDSVE
ncbi:MAG TPA: hypothetical protein VN031_01290 [Candidatus Microsaccharimonas sp.]|nr:hypothetical protein [Candidatus Microsaccharimonas sp.]